MRFEKSLLLKPPRSELWTFLANTERFNREIGLPPVRYTFSPQASGGSVIFAGARIFGQQLKWREMPFEWVEPRWFQVQRIYGSGPFRKIVLGVRLEETSDGTCATCLAEVAPKNLMGKILAPIFVGKKALQDFERACRNFEAFYRTGQSPTPHSRGYGDGAQTAYPRQAAVTKPVDRNRLAALATELLDAGVEETLLARLISHIEAAPDLDLIRFRPFDLADAWGADRLQVLTLCLQATRAGLLDLQWSVLCPSCRGVKQVYSHLRDLRPRGHCDACNIEYGVDFDRFMEVRFTVNPNVRPAREEIYCIGGPMNTPHIHAQFFVRREGRADIPIRLTSGRFWIRSLQVESPAELMVVPASSEKSARIEIGKVAVISDRHELAADEELSLRFANTCEVDIQIKVETQAWGERGASAALVTSLQEFRDLFSSEVLAPGLEIAIRNLAVLFSDLKGSTHIYESIGDAPAYGLVRDHFEFMAERIGKHRGGLVKTMGDAVMAAFLHPADCIRAAAEVQRDLLGLHRQHPELPPLVLKLGAHCGPCIAVNANDHLDYFGTTVNVAQRAQDQSTGGDMVITDRMLADPEVRLALEGEAAQISRYESRLRGLEAQFVLYRVVYGQGRRRPQGDGGVG